MKIIEEFFAGIDRTTTHLSKDIDEAMSSPLEKDLNEQRTNLCRLRLFLSNLVTLLEDTS